MPHLSFRDKLHFWMFVCCHPLNYLHCIQYIFRFQFPVDVMFNMSQKKNNTKNTIYVSFYFPERILTKSVDNDIELKSIGRKIDEVIAIVNSGNSIMTSNLTTLLNVDLPCKTCAELEVLNSLDSDAALALVSCVFFLLNLITIICK